MGWLPAAAIAIRVILSARVSFCRNPIPVRQWKLTFLTFKIRQAPLEFLRMIVVHELAHLKEKEHSKPFYQLCEHMEPAYQQLEFDETSPLFFVTPFYSFVVLPTMW